MTGSINAAEYGGCDNSDFGIAFVSAPPDAVEKIAREIVSRKLAACAQVTSPVSSIYWWKGKLETEPERLIILKTRRSLLPELKNLISRIHPYEVPELTFVAITDGAESYLSWMEEVLGPRNPRAQE
jgi:periplasmic divalent cation tolerance protein